MREGHNAGAESQRFDWDALRQRIAATSAALADLDRAAPEVMQQVWARRAAQLAQVPPREEQGERIELVAVRLGREIYGLEAQCVFDIKPVELVTRVPRVPDWVAGVTNLRGSILSVLDLRRFFGLAGDGAGAAQPQGLWRAGDGGNGEGRGMLVVVETERMELALLVDEVLSVEALPANHVQEATDTVRSLPAEYVRGVSGWRGDMGGDGLLVVLDLPALLADERLLIWEEMV